MSGRYGPYVKWEKVNATLPKDADPDILTLAAALDLIATKATKKGTKRKAAPKKAAAKASGKTATAKKPAAKKGTANAAKTAGESPKAAE
jgi:DNA topoisomerase-1